MTTNRSGTRGVARPEREALILDAAVAEFGLGGYSGTSVAAIATRAGVSKALILAYFGTKDALYCASVATVAEPILEHVTAAVEDSRPGWPMALETLAAIATSVQERPRDWLLVDNVVRLDDEKSARELAAIQLRFRALSTQGIRALLDGGGREFDARDVDLLCTLWESAVSSSMQWWMAHPDEAIEGLLARGARIIESLSAS